MMYRRENQGRKSHRGGRRRKLRSALFLFGVVCLVGGMIAFVTVCRAGNRAERLAMSDDAVVEGEVENNDANKVYRRRIVRDAIPEINYRNINYRELFNDSNYVQLSAARANGIDPSKVVDPAESEWLVPIFSTRSYQVDTMYHSVPYLLPEAVLLLDYIGHRFSLLMEKHYPSIGEHKIVVTSALRTEQGERRLRRVNRNATDTSCHIYGTTFDLSAQRFEHVASGHDTVVDACRQMLAMALYELRYEGLCYVKYERGSCFHITLITTQYEGSEESETRSYINPGSPDYLLTKAPPRPKPPVYKESGTQNDGSAVRKPSRRAEKKKSRKAAQPQPRNENKTSAQPTRNDGITERERLSLEQYERRY